MFRAKGGFTYDETFYETEKRLNVINHLKDKYGSTIEEILDTYEKKCKRCSGGSARYRIR